MVSEILINSSSRETRIARLENGQLAEIHIERKRERNLVGSIYRGRVTRVLPGMQAAFVEIGLERTAFLYVTHILDPNRNAEDLLGENEVGAEELEADDALEAEGPAKDPTGPRERPDSIPRKPDRPQLDISKLIREGESVLVQILKEPMGTKGARLTGYISIPGRYLVYLPDSQHLGISRRIEDPAERDRLKSIVEKHRPNQGGFIVRTVAESATEKQIKDDLDYLIKLWGSIKRQAQKQTSPGLVHSDLDLTTRILRDRVTDDVERIVVDDLATFKHITKFIQNFLPRFKKRIELHSEPESLFDQYGLESELSRAIARKVWLKSGGYIVIDEAEALTAIDVNTGRFVGRRNLEDTILQTNLEAVKEIAYQIRLRNLGGIIVLDFIDMLKSQHNEKIYNALLEELKKDPVRTNVLPMSQLGLIEMTRKRTQESLRIQLTSGCQYCDGKGYLRSIETLAYQILRDCEKEARKNVQGNTIAIYCHPSLAEFFTETDRQAAETFENKTGKRLSIRTDPELHLEDYEIFSRETP